MLDCRAILILTKGTRVMTEIANTISGLIWGHVLVYLLIAAGLFFTVRLGFIQFRDFGHTFKVMFNSRQGAQGGIS